MKKQDVGLEDPVSATYGSHHDLSRHGVGRVVLTGFRATGKSVVGRRVADGLGWEFIDTDDILAARFGCPVAAYVALHGWALFRKAENGLLLELASSARRVIATGGGAIQHRTAWERLRAGALAVWLRADAATIRNRLAEDVRTRGMRPSLTGGDLLEEVEELVRQRAPLYRAGSDICLDSATRTPGELAAAIINRVGASAVPDAP